MNEACEDKIKSHEERIALLEEDIKKMKSDIKKLNTRLSIFESGFKYIKKDLQCPITKKIFKCPVIAQSRKPYEKYALKGFMKKN